MSTHRFCFTAQKLTTLSKIDRSDFLIAQFLPLVQICGKYNTLFVFTEIFAFVLAAAQFYHVFCYGSIFVWLTYRLIFVIMHEHEHFHKNYCSELNFDF